MFGTEYELLLTFCPEKYHSVCKQRNTQKQASYPTEVSKMYKIFRQNHQKEFFKK